MEQKITNNESGVLVCPKCKSEIPSDNVKKADIDCDCGQVVTKATALKILPWEFGKKYK